VYQRYGVRTRHTRSVLSLRLALRIVAALKPVFAFERADRPVPGVQTCLSASLCLREPFVRAWVRGSQPRRRQA
jgi:hypothetical protein